MELELELYTQETLSNGHFVSKVVLTQLTRVSCIYIYGTGTIHTGNSVK